jgi:hypothetical protein
MLSITETDVVELTNAFLQVIVSEVYPFFEDALHERD